jgi:flavin reductase (DIM6/NTAB) family NADH-FMN oxidoreductase RutF
VTIPTRHRPARSNDPGPPDGREDLAEAVRAALRRCRAPMAVLSTGTPGKPVGCTVSSFLSLSLAPPSLLVSLQLSSTTLAHVRADAGFGLSLLSGRQTGLAARFARGTHEERFDGTAVAGLDGMPVLAHAPVAFTCRVRTEMAVHDHVLVVGDIVAVRTTGGSGSQEASP